MAAQRIGEQSACWMWERLLPPLASIDPLEPATDRRQRPVFPAALKNLPWAIFSRPRVDRRRAVPSPEKAASPI